MSELTLDYYLTETLRIQDSGIADPDLMLAQRLLDWLHDLGEKHVYLAKIYQFGPSGIRDAKTARKLLGILEDHRWIVRIQGGMRLDEAHRKDAWRIVGKEAKP